MIKLPLGYSLVETYALEHLIEGIGYLNKQVSELNSRLKCEREDAKVAYDNVDADFKEAVATSCFYREHYARATRALRGVNSVADESLQQLSELEESFTDEHLYRILGTRSNHPTAATEHGG